MRPFKLTSEYKPCGDQPQAIKLLSEGVKHGLREQVLLGVVQRVVVQVGLTQEPGHQLPERKALVLESLARVIQL